MQYHAGTFRYSLADPVLRAMFAARKAVFVDRLKWNAPVLADRYEIDQFDNEDATYLLLSGSAGNHRASTRLLRTEGPHILADLFPVLCDETPPVHPDVREITRFCIDPSLKRAEHRQARNQLVSILVDYALATGIAGYTAVANLAWFRQISRFGWRCHALGPCCHIGGENLVAMMIDIDRDTPQSLSSKGIYCEVPFDMTKMEQAA